MVLYFLQSTQKLKFAKKMFVFINQMENKNTRIVTLAYRFLFSF